MNAESLITNFDSFQPFLVSCPLLPLTGHSPSAQDNSRVPESDGDERKSYRRYDGANSQIKASWPVATKRNLWNERYVSNNSLSAGCLTDISPIT